MNGDRLAITSRSYWKTTSRKLPASVGNRHWQVADSLKQRLSPGFFPQILKSLHGLPMGGEIFRSHSQMMKSVWWRSLGSTRTRVIESLAESWITALPETSLNLVCRSLQLKPYACTLMISCSVPGGPPSPLLKSMIVSLPEPTLNTKVSSLGPPQSSRYRR
jgi:hypothetical protein